MDYIKSLQESRFKLNTIELEQGLSPFGNIDEHCYYRINGNLFDSNLEFFFNIENKKKAFGINYKDNNTIEIKQSDGSIEKINIPSIINGGMGTNVSSYNLVEAMNEIGFGGHLSSIGIGFYYFNDNYKNFSSLNNKEKNNIIQKEFDDIFIKELGLNYELINKHFFICNDLGISEKRNIRFNGELGKEKYTRMMDLIAIYKNITKLKNSGNNVGINCMYKTSSYIATIKMAILSGVDYITTAAGNPDINPKDFLKDFYFDLDSNNINYKIAAQGLLISISRALNDYDYDYYIFEEGHKAGGHIIRLGKLDKYQELEKIKIKFKKKGKKIPPIYAAGGVEDNEEIKKVLEAGFDGIQFGTLAAVSFEAVNGKGEKFKKKLIVGNHIGKKTQEDQKYEIFVNNEYNKFQKIINYSNYKILKYINKDLEQNDKIDKNNEKIQIIKDYIFKIIYKNFFNNDISELNKEEKLFYNKINKFLEFKFGGDIDKISKAIRDYGNSLKFINQFDNFLKKDLIPTHLVFDSTVGFPGRTKIFKDVYKVIAGEVKSSGCVNCLTNCILAKRGLNQDYKSSTFCIYDWLDQTDSKKQNIAFSGLSTVPYSEIRHIKDIMAYYMGTYVER